VTALESMSARYQLEAGDRVAPPPVADEISALTLVNAVLRDRVLLLRLAIIGGLLAGSVALLKERTYTASAAFAPQSKRAVPGVSGLAAQFGVNLGTSDVTASPQFYVSLLTSRTILHRLVDTPFATAAGGATKRPLLTLLDVEGETPAARKNAALERLRRAIGASTDLKTGLVTVTVSLPDPVLSSQVTERLLAEVNAFNLESRRSQAVFERRFAEEQLREAAQSLRIAEDRYAAFVSRNRVYTTSPDLRNESERLQRAVSMREQVFVTLSQAYEQAKLDEVRNTPAITVVEQPEVPFRPDPRGTLMMGILGGTVGAFLGLLIAIARRVMDQRPRGDELAQFAELRRAAAADLKRPWRLLRRSA
jgi:uncharacterized protein involved in exopolysaccharide biosynthesis